MSTKFILRGSRLAENAICRSHSNRLGHLFRQWRPVIRPTSRRWAHAYQTAQPTMPEKLVVFDSGVIRTTFVGCLKMATIIMAVANTAVIVPALFNDPARPSWNAPLVFVGGMLPFLFVFWASKPFVVRAVIRLPTIARRSKPSLQKWRPAPDTEVSFVTMTWFGFPHESATVPLSGLRRAFPTLGEYNVERISPEGPKLPYMWGLWTVRQQGRFYLGEDRRQGSKLFSLQDALAKR